jgi:plasmid stabilization system protein ParE
MVYKITLTERALTDLKNVFEYLDNHWGISVSQKFSDILTEKLDFIKAQPHSNRLISKSKNIYRCLISRHNAAYYQIIEAEIITLTIFDTRQHPKKLKL